MYAIIATGGKQYKVEEGDVINGDQTLITLMDIPENA